MNLKPFYQTALHIAVIMLLGVHVSFAECQRDSIPRSAYEVAYPYPFALGVHMGTTGVGLQVFKPLGTHFGAQLSASYMPFNTDVVGTYSNRATRSDVEAKSGNVSLLFGWSPVVRERGFFKSFNIQLGAAYFFKLRGSITTGLKDPYKFGEIAVDPMMVGDIQTNVKWKESISPYAGIAWSNVVIDSRFSMHLNLGCYYLSKPTVDMKATGLLEDNTGNQATIERNMANYRYLPRVEVGVSYRFWK